MSEARECYRALKSSARALENKRDVDECGESITFTEKSGSLPASPPRCREGEKRGSREKPDPARSERPRTGKETTHGRGWESASLTAAVQAGGRRRRLRRLKAGAGHGQRNSRGSWNRSEQEVGGGRDGFGLAGAGFVGGYVRARGRSEEGFVLLRSTMEAIHLLRDLMEKYKERKKLLMNLNYGVDLTMGATESSRLASRLRLDSLTRSRVKLIELIV
ncbi:hypothetical protein KFK09_022856 [Dendrobium nobile]|uniref:Uncharacterized protein n=1 Tax=Dendrobium nobile TaxID=94219 RepID=A0A8T3AIZ0_DENNO|nr:hypothetical protein KFK09_022856 [Dendrobium nobile]